MTSIPTDNPAFYRESGLRFECRRCSDCCRLSPGYVFLSRTDLKSLLAATGPGFDSFKRLYLRAVWAGLHFHLCLKEKSNYDCIFWEYGGCAVYAARPLQCRSFPFWTSILANEATWRDQGNRCPGIGSGPLRSAPEIDAWLEARRTNEIIRLPDDDLAALTEREVFGAGESE